jgi:uncharacterized metal-binding protein
MTDPKRIAIVPCSGIGKTSGTVSREAAYEVTEDLRPDRTRIIALSLLVLGDEAARAAVSDNPAITIDGCKLACATKVCQVRTGRVAQVFDVMDTYRRNRQLKSQGIAELNEDGKKLAHALAEEICEAVDRLTAAKKGKQDNA